MLRNVAGVVLGIAVGFVAAMAFLSLSMWLSSDSEGVASKAPEGFEGLVFV